MDRFIVGWCVGLLFMNVLNIVVYPKEENTYKLKVYNLACEHKCGKDKFELVNHNNLCVCKDGKSYKRNFSKLYQ